MIAAGGIWDRQDIDKMLDLGAEGVQMGTRFLGAKECDAKYYNELMLRVKKEEIELIKSPVGYPARAVITGVIQELRAGRPPKSLVLVIV